MYQYDDIDRRIVRQRVAQFRDQTRRYLAKELTDDEFRPLRLQNGLYLQRHAPMLRIAIPYGGVSAVQLRALARISRRYDRGYAHFTTRHNLQLNWPRLAEVPDILAELAEVDMHAIQTSGSCIRNITTDAYAGIAEDEIEDPRPLAEILRQWSTLHPEFAYLPRKFKVAITGAREDRAVTRLHDLALQLVRSATGEPGVRVLVGGGMGRTPIVAATLREFLPRRHVLTYIEAICRVYNRYGRRDNLFKARIKILVKAIGIEEFRRQVEEEWAHLADGPSSMPQDEINRVRARFTRPAYQILADEDLETAARLHQEPAFAAWYKRNVRRHRIAGYAAVTLSLKATGAAPGDVSAEQLEQVAALADAFSFGEVRVTHEQNLVLADVRKRDLYPLWRRARAAGLATPNIGLLTDIVCCPGGDFCAQANARSIPIAQAIQERFDDLDELHDIGEIALNISGCMNSCGHHHVGHIGVLGVDKHGEEWYQVSIGGHPGGRIGADAQDGAAIGEILGPSFAAGEVPDVVERLIETYLTERHGGERFIDTVRRVGVAPFKRAAYAQPQRERKAAHA
jgi:sulfite reductase (NADPH) hemoprotein beta-component